MVVGHTKYVVKQWYFGEEYGQCHRVYRHTKWLMGFQWVALTPTRDAVNYYDVHG